LLQNIWQEVENDLYVSKATNGAHIELAQGKKSFELLLAMLRV
jgi:hypothetical protein